MRMAALVVVPVLVLVLGAAPIRALEPAFVRGRISAFVVVDMFMTTSTAVLPGVIGVDGSNMHCAPAGSPAVHESVTAALNEDPGGFGAIANW
jgi:hypothetical protein